MLIGLAVFQLIPDKLLLLFNASDHMLNIGVPALRTISLSFLFAGFCIVVGSVFQALGNGIYSLIISIARQLVVLLPAAYILTISLSFLFAGFCIVVGSVFQALGNGIYSLIISIARQLVVLLPAAYILAHTLGLNAVWWSFNIAEIVSLLMSAVLLKKIYKEKIQSM